VRLILTSFIESSYVMLASAIIVAATGCAGWEANQVQRPSAFGDSTAYGLSQSHGQAELSFTASNPAAPLVEHVTPIGDILPAAYQPETSPSQGDMRNQVDMGDSLHPPSELIPAPGGDLATQTIALADVISSIHATFPLVEAAYQERQVAEGKAVAAWGEFDTKFKAASENGPLGFYENYRHNAGLVRPLYQGGELFGGYRIGRGDFEPWYLERQTNEGGELRAGWRVPLMRNREIDARRAALWRANYEQQRAEPEIRGQLVGFVREGTVAYWKWIAAGRKHEIGVQALRLAEQRTAQIQRRVDLGDVDPPVLQDNLRAIAQREAKLIDLRRKLQQAGFSLSLFYRSKEGEPRVPDATTLADFPQPAELAEISIEDDLAIALEERPELAVLDAMASSVKVDLAEARNDTLPNVNAQLSGSQDVGGPTSVKRDKSQFELEAGLFVDVPLQRRKARGKLQAAEAKLIQLSAKRRFVEDKIRTELQYANAAITAAIARLERARESKRLAELMADVERRKFELGESNLLSVVLREQDAIEAAEAEVDAMLEFFMALADYNAALANDWPE